MPTGTADVVEMASIATSAVAVPANSVDFISVVLWMRVDVDKRQQVLVGGV
jgi:hypothetical protein